jgi:hypothetical protein
LPSACRGAFYAINSDGSVTVFAGTANKLYMLSNTTYTWTDVSNGGTTYASVSPAYNWDFVQTGSLVFATQSNCVLQVFTLGRSTAFTNALGSPPQAAYMDVVGQFIVLTGLTSYPYRVQWSGLNNYNASNSWDNITLGSNYQDFADGGIVRGMAGGETGIIFQDQATRTMSYIPGSPLTFQIERISQEKGLFAPYSVIRGGERIFYFAGQGFQMLLPGGIPQAIGRERVDRTFLVDVDKTSLQLFVGAADPRTSRVYWAYKSVNGTNASGYDKILGYDYSLDRWFTAGVSGQYLVSVSQPGLTLDTLDAGAPTPLTITGAANNGSGAIRLTLAAETSGTPPYGGYTILGQPTITVYNVTGTTEANGTWKFTVVDTTHIDLIGSTFTHLYVSGGQIGGSLDAMTLSLDSYATAVQPALSQFDTTATLGIFSGAPLQALVESGEQGTDGERMRMRGFRIVTDAPTVYGSIDYRELTCNAPITSPEVGRSARTGRCDMSRSTRYVRYRARVPAGLTWNYLAGVEADTTTEGKN